MRLKAAERDPEKRIYNDTMTAKVLALADKLALSLIHISEPTRPY